MKNIYWKKPMFPMFLPPICYFCKRPIKIPVEELCCRFWSFLIDNEIPFTFSSELEHKVQHQLAYLLLFHKLEHPTPIDTAVYNRIYQINLSLIHISEPTRPY